MGEDIKHPLQQIYRDSKGIIRFRENKIVRYLLDAGPYDLNWLALMGFGDEEHEQFAQLIGYSVSGFGDLDYVSEDTYEVAEGLSERYQKDEEMEVTHD